MLYVGYYKVDESNTKMSFTEGTLVEQSSSNAFFHAQYYQNYDYFFVGTVAKISTTNYNPLAGYAMRTGTTYTSLNIATTTFTKSAIFTFTSITATGTASNIGGFSTSVTSATFNQGSIAATT